MIDKTELIDGAAASRLTPHVVEKDYVLGWLLWGIDSLRAVGESWMFKGGTCLKVTAHPVVRLVIRCPG